MVNQIKCPHCGKDFEITDVFRHQIREEVVAEVDEKNKKEIEFFKEKITKEVEEKNTLEVTDLKKQLDEKEKKVKDYIQMELKMREEKEKWRKERELKLEVQRQIDEKRKEIEEETIKRSIEDHRLKDLEKDKLIGDLKKSLEEAQRKATQGSQQTQGEVMELELEDLLKKRFTDDEIREVKKGQRGADVLQIVNDKIGRNCGKILWESKNAKWQEGWISKLRDDQREAKAELAVLVVENAPQGLDTVDYHDRVWIVKRKFAEGLAIALRYDLIHIYFEKAGNVGKDEKMEIVYSYLTGPEFKHRIEAIVDAFSALQENIEKEKRFFSVKWAREEKEIRKIIDNTHGMWGELQSVTNRGLPQIKNLELDRGD